MNIFEIKRELSQLADIVEFEVDYFNHQHSKLKIKALDLSVELMNKVMRYRVKYMDFKTINTLSNMEDYKENFKEVLKLKDVSLETVLLYIKKNANKRIKLENDFYKLKKAPKNILNNLKEIKEGIVEYKKYNLEQELSQINELRKMLMSITDADFGVKDDNYIHLYCLLPEKETINKNNFISLLDIRHEKYVIDLIKNAPDELTLKDIENLVFVHKIEGDNDWMFEIMFRKFSDVLDSNEELRQKLYRDTGLNRIPSLSVKFDEFGDVAEIKQNPPKLELIKGDEIK